MLINKIWESSKIFVTLNGKATPQRVFLEINQQLTRIDYERSDKERDSNSVVLRRLLRVYLPVIPTVDKANWILERYLRQLQRIYEGHYVVYNAKIGDEEGVLTDDAERALQEIIDGICSLDCYEPDEILYIF